MLQGQAQHQLNQRRFSTVQGSNHLQLPEIRSGKQAALTSSELRAKILHPQERRELNRNLLQRSLSQRLRRRKNSRLFRHKLR